MNGKSGELISVLDRDRPVLVQTHDFPDHDAMGAAYALCELLERRGFRCSMTYGGKIQSISLDSMIRKLGIDLVDFPAARENAAFQTVIVDGAPGGGTVETVAGTLVGYIDHHPAPKSAIARFSDVRFVDVRIDVGSCSTIVWTYWKESGEKPDRTSATALLAGIQLDTDFLSRRVSPVDLEAHAALYFLGDPELSREIVHTSLSVAELPDIGQALSTAAHRGPIVVAELSGDYPSELLSVLADFLLRLRETEFSVVAETGGNDCRLSARSRNPALDAGLVLSRSLAGLGSGGGHPHMAGGIMPRGRYPGKEALLGIFYERARECGVQERS
jgi:nanoRNase/pAp phosphatase (c-di-AMP/oligoRNAs hydrolase)